MLTIVTNNTVVDGSLRFVEHQNTLVSQWYALLPTFWLHWVLAGGPSLPKWAPPALAVQTPPGPQTLLSCAYTSASTHSVHEWGGRRREEGMMVEGCHGKSGTQATPGERDTTSVRTDAKHRNTGQLNKPTSQFCYFSKSLMCCYRL